MDDAKRDLVHAWLIKALNDLRTARAVGNLAEGPLDTAIYHCQQAAEKALKGFLASAATVMGFARRALHAAAVHGPGILIGLFVAHGLDWV